MTTDRTTSRPIDIAPSGDPHANSSFSPSSAQSPSSALSASLKAFSDLSLVNKPPVKLESDEFKQAMHHARRASFNSGTATRPIMVPSDEPRNVPALSTSPGSNVSDLSSLPTPSSSPPATSSTLAQAPTSSSASSLKRSASTGGNGTQKTAAVPILGGVCEKEEIEALESGSLALDEPASAPAHHHSRSVSNTEGSSLFAGGAKWGWPGSGGNGANSPPRQNLSMRRGSLGFASPPGSSTLPLHPAPVAAASSGGSIIKNSPPLPPTQVDPYSRMQPLGRVVSAGASLQTSKDGNGSGEGFNLFRRLSIGGFGAKKRPSPPSPPSLALPPRESTFTAPESSVGSGDPLGRGRTLAATGSATAKPKRKLSPMGEKFLRGGY
ncbi:uncharacterized protein JCM15063_004175 [Sporobolomyces koalae]|uniref:uncharacterized protein n=1 Tax=Sporobolomyces koalae TaxID=500713 RepID=UPI0031809622